MSRLFVQVDELTNVSKSPQKFVFCHVCSYFVTFRIRWRTFVFCHFCSYFVTFIRILSLLFVFCHFYSYFVTFIRILSLFIHYHYLTQNHNNIPSLEFLFLFFFDPELENTYYRCIINRCLPFLTAPSPEKVNFFDKNGFLLKMVLMGIFTNRN